MILKILPVEYEVSFEAPKFIDLVIENKNLYFKVESSIYLESETNALFDIMDGGKHFIFDDFILNIENCFSYDLNNKKNINLLLKHIKKTYYENLESDISSLREKASDIIKKISIELGFDLVSKEEISADDLFKTLEIKFEEKEEEPHLNFLDYLLIVCKLNKRNFIICHNIWSFFEKEEIETIIHELLIQGISILNIQNHDLDEKIDDEIRIIMDKDLCVIG